MTKCWRREHDECISYDYEVAVQYLSALPYHPDVFITRDKRGFNDFVIQVMNPADFVNKAKQQLFSFRTGHSNAEQPFFFVGGFPLRDSHAHYLRLNIGVVYQTQNHVNHSVWDDFIDRSFFSYQREKADVEIHQFELQTGDRIFLCTDGVCQYIDPSILTDRLMDDVTADTLTKIKW